MSDVCEECGENATVPGQCAKRCAECLDELFGREDTPTTDTDDTLEALPRVAHVVDAGRYNGGIEVTLLPEASGVPLLVAHYLAESGRRIVDVSPQGVPEHLIVRAE